MSFLDELVQKALAEHNQKLQEQTMINPFMQGRRNAGAQNNPFQRSMTPRQNPFMGQQNLAGFKPQQKGMSPQQSAGPTQQMAGPTQQAVSASMQQSVDPRMQTGQQYGPQPGPQPTNPFTYNPDQRSPDLYQGQYWPTQGELTLISQGIDPWGGQAGPDQQQWLQQVGPYAGVPQFTSSYDGRTDVGRDFTAVQLAAQAGGDPSKAFRDAWLGASKPQTMRNNYGIWHNYHNSGAAQAAQDQWGGRYGWNQPATPGPSSPGGG